jgi:hypothetical protein
MRRVTGLIVVLVVAVVAGSVPASAADTTDPRVEWLNPFETPPPSDEELTVDDGSIRLNATIHDSSAIEYVDIEREYSDGQTDDRDYRQVDNLHNVTVHAGTFSETTVRIRVFDTAGNVDVTEFKVEVNDETAPTADLNTERTNDGQIRLTGTVHDQTQPSRVAVLLPDESNPVVHSRAGDQNRQRLGGVDIARNSFEVDKTFNSPTADSV